MFSIYTSAFNLIKNNFDYKSALENFCAFADEVVVAVNISEDNTFEALSSLRAKYPNLNIIRTSFPYEEVSWDGNIKNAALQATTQEFKIGLDMDERISLRDKGKWESVAYSLRFSEFDSFLIPSLNLWGSLDTVKDSLEENIKFKWYLHKGGLFRGTVNFAKLPGGKIDITKSDSCELIDSNGNLAKSKRFYSHVESLDEWLTFINNNIFIYHLGYASFSDRELRNKFWAPRWSEKIGGAEIPKNIIFSAKEMAEQNIRQHNLRLWDES
jgi:hypothetical protein